MILYGIIPYSGSCGNVVDILLWHRVQKEPAVAGRSETLFLISRVGPENWGPGETPPPVYTGPGYIRVPEAAGRGY